MAAVIPAAGSCARMGDFKPLLPLGDKSVIEWVIGKFKDAGIADIRVVVGHRAAELIPVIEKTGARWVENPNFASGMFSSIQAGVAALPPWADAFFVLPADIPLVRGNTLAALIEGWRAHGGPLLYPTFEGRRGHPPLITTTWAGQIQTYREGGGMQGFLQTREAEACEVPVADEGILLDLDTPEDYREACIRHDKFDIPTPAECGELMKLSFGSQAPVIDHCQAVARIALRLTTALNRAGYRINPDLVQAASLVHDIAKGSPDHAVAGARLLTALGFPRVGDMVREHMDLKNAASGPLQGKEVVYLADKLIQGQRPVDLNTRFDDKLKRHGDDPAKHAAITRRRDQALAVKARIDACLGRPLQTVLEGPGQ